MGCPTGFSKWCMVLWKCSPFKTSAQERRWGRERNRGRKIEKRGCFRPEEYEQVQGEKITAIKQARSRNLSLIWTPPLAGLSLFCMLISMSYFLSLICLCFYPCSQAPHSLQRHQTEHKWRLGGEGVCVCVCACVIVYPSTDVCVSALVCLCTRVCVGIHVCVNVRARPRVCVYERVRVKPWRHLDLSYWHDWIWSSLTESDPAPSWSHKKQSWKSWSVHKQNQSMKKTQWLTQLLCPLN